MKDKGYVSYKQIYLKYRKDFLRYGNSYALDEARLADLYQDAFVAFYENCISGKVSRLTSSLKTYLFAIGKNLILKDLRKNKGKKTDEIDAMIPDKSPYILEEIILDEEQKKVLRNLKMMGPSCRRVLLYFYYHKLSIKEIKNKMGYNSDNVTKSKKSQCIKKLRKMWKD